MGGRQPYPSDLSDEAWELIRPFITSWKGQHRSVGGHEGRYEVREIDAILYWELSSVVIKSGLGCRSGRSVW